MGTSWFLGGAFRRSGKLGHMDGMRHDRHERIVARLVEAVSVAGLERSGLVSEAAELERVALQLAPVWDATGVRIRRVPGL